MFLKAEARGVRGEKEVLATEKARLCVISREGWGLLARQRMTSGTKA